VSVETFVPAMASHWRNLGNVESDELRAVWTRVCIALNSQVLQHGTHEADFWRVIPAELGSGKTEGLKLYCSLLPKATHQLDEPHPGVLIIVRLIRQADEIAADINRLAGEGTAFAYHSSSLRIPLEDLQRFPVLVITHAAYEQGRDALSRTQADGRAKWKHLHEWGLEGRKLIVIDEALDLIREERATLKNIRHLRSIIPDGVALRHRKAVRALDTTIEALSSFASKKVADRVSQPAVLPDLVDFESLWRDLKAVTQWPSTLVFGDPSIPGSEEHAKRKFFARLRLTLSGVQALLERWHWYYRKLGDHTLTTAWFLLPDEGIQGAVILDATAERNLLYRLFETRVDVVTIPNVRCYQNVTAYASREDAVGKHAMLENADSIIRSVVADLQAHYKDRLESRSVLFVTHRDAAPIVQKWAGSVGFGKAGVIWWNAIDGRNDWNDFNTVVILSQPFRDPSTPANIFQAIFGPQSTDWLNNPSLRRWKDCADVLSDLETSHLVVSNAQAINRVQCRRVIDDRGNCKPTDVFIRLPKDRTGGAILAGLRLSMPGLKVREWARSSTDRETKLTPSYEDALIAYARNLDPGYHPALRVREALDISERQWFRLVKLIDGRTDTNLAQSLAEADVSYVVQQTGKVRRAYLQKTGEDAP
jgi:hypothetical protein